jgi:predicted RNA polymerase sigma factor
MEKDLDFIHNRFDDAIKSRMEVEVIYSALQAMQEDPSITISRAFEIGCEEWDV